MPLKKNAPVIKSTSINFALVLFSIIGLFSCQSGRLLTELGAKGFARGADVSWLPQMEATGFKFRNDKGEEEDCLKILKDHGINTIRLRTFVNPSNDPRSGHCSKDETVAMAVRCQKMGMRIM